MESHRCTAADHALLKLDPAAWAALPYVGRQDELEVRNCDRCLSTLAKEVEADAAQHGAVL